MKDLYRRIYPHQQNYNQYLSSPEWKERRKAILKRDNFQCQMCGTGKNLRVHHIHYSEILGTEPDEDLITVCDDCHKRIHRLDIELGNAPKWKIDIERRRRWVNEAKLQDFIYGGTKNMCALKLLQDSIADFNFKNDYSISGVSSLQHPLGFAHWKLVNEMFKRGYTPEEIRMITPLDLQQITKYLTKDRSGEEERWDYMIPLDEINMLIRRYIQDDLDRRV